MLNAAAIDPAVGSECSLLDTKAPGTRGEVANRSRRRAIALWLFTCCVLVCAMVVVGGVTRLTHSGLSITEWQPIVGTIPPHSGASWDEAFRKYQATPEYREINRGMDIAGFKRIFWWEYAHRLLGRLIGAAFLIPLCWFALRGRIPPGLAPKLSAIFLLGALQGALGWYMVRSGLVHDPRVSQVRLAAHLGVALLILGAMLWLALSLVRPARGSGDATRERLARFARAVVALVLVMALSGGLVAGIHAGLAYNSFPLMNGHIIPSEIMLLEPWYRNLVDNMATVQFDHRAIALLLAIVVSLYCWRVHTARAIGSAVRIGAYMLLAALAVQVTLGIATLLLVVPLPLAAAHQAGAVVLFAAAINAAHTLGRDDP